MKVVYDEFNNLVFTEYNKSDFDKHNQDNYCNIVATERDNLKRLYQSHKEIFQGVPMALTLGIAALSFTPEIIPYVSTNVLSGIQVISAISSVTSAAVSVYESIVANKISKKIISRQSDNLEEYASVHALPNKKAALEDITAKTDKIFEKIDKER